MGAYSIKHKIIFSHVAKCAGSTIMAGLQESIGSDFYKCNPHCGLDFLFKEIKSNNANPLEFRRLVSVRNPWDRAVSLYHYILDAENGYIKTIEAKTKKIYKKKINEDFNQFVKLIEPLPSHYYDRYHYIIKFEELQSGFDKFCNICNIPKTKLRNFNKNFIRPDDYRTLYNDESIQIIRSKFQDIIDRFQYSF